MVDVPEGPAREARLREVLLGYLLAAGLPDWPGADGLTLEVVLRTYASYAAAGRVPGQRLLLLWYPELGAEIDAFFGPHAGGDGGTATEANTEEMI
jgi:hypothetical protein